ncbi:MAG: hypothetical protein KAU60_01800 [Desulfobacterales bacterium]|jgi:hypothetical protein|nr:hypothetical protein [Desulfobacterales bacterium]
MAEIIRNVKNIFNKAGFLLVGVDVSKAKHDACTTKCNFAKNEDALEWVTYLFVDVPQIPPINPNQHMLRLLLP